MCNEKVDWTMEEPGDRAFAALEGICLHCGVDDTQLIEVSGYEPFIQDHGQEGVKVRQWKGQPDQFSDAGDLTFHCPACGNDNEVYNTCGGDWSA